MHGGLGYTRVHGGLGYIRVHGGLGYTRVHGGLGYTRVHGGLGYTRVHGGLRYTRVHGGICLHVYVLYFYYILSLKMSVSIIMYGRTSLYMEHGEYHIKPTT